MAMGTNQSPSPSPVVARRGGRWIGVALTDTILEWALIALLLVNAALSYLIGCFAAACGLRPPCILCSRIDPRPYRRLVCDDHAEEISRLRLCPAHRRLAEEGGVCGACGGGDDQAEDGERCSCCGAPLGELLKNEEPPGEELENRLIDPMILEGNEEEDGFDCWQMNLLMADHSLEAIAWSTGGLQEEDRLVPIELIDSGTVMDSRIVVKLEAEVLVADNGNASIELVELNDCGTIIRFVAEDGDESIELAELVDCGVVIDSLMVVKLDGEDGLDREEKETTAEDDLIELREMIDCGTITDSLTVMILGNDLNGAEKMDHGTKTDSLMVVKFEGDGSIDREERAVTKLLSEDEAESIELPELIDCGTITDSLTVVRLEGDGLNVKEDKTVAGLVAEDEDELIELTGLIDCRGITDALMVVKSEGEGGIDREEKTVAGLVAEDLDESIELHEFIDCGIIADSLMVLRLEEEDDVDKEMETVAEFVIEDQGETIFSSMDLIELPGYALEPPERDIRVLHDGVCALKESNLFLGREAITQAKLVEHTEVEGPVHLSEGIIDEFPISAEDIKGAIVEDSCEVSIGSEICEQASVSEPVPPLGIFGNHFIERYIDGVDVDEDFGNESLDISPGDIGGISIYPEINVVERERTPETPTYIDGIHSLHRRFLFERRESGTDSIDGSVSSEIEDAETITIDHLKAALKSERKARSALYIELEEERSASAIAANQTMAMITRLQEEKSTMQMEALQYQRMMEEQSEYDRDALQLLNDLMMKRAKEKQELEKELDLYRKKVRLYKSSERRKMLSSRTNSRCGTCSSFSSAEDSDDLSFDINGGDDYFDLHQETNQNTPSETIFTSETDHENSKHLISLDESLAEFEVERLAILEQLKSLEDRLFMSNDRDVSDNKEFDQHSSEENEVNVHHEPSDDLNAFMNGVQDGDGTREARPADRKSMAYGGKSLLPLFDAVCPENEVHDSQVEDDSSHEFVTHFTTVQKKLAIAEEVDDVYERLQALEADRGFLKHCICSLKKGDKGIDLLQEILQHLKDLRAVELRVRNAGDALASLSA